MRARWMERGMSFGVCFGETRFVFLMRDALVKCEFFLKYIKTHWLDVIKKFLYWTTEVFTALLSGDEKDRLIDAFAK